MSNFKFRSVGLVLGLANPRIMICRSWRCYVSQRPNPSTSFFLDLGPITILWPLNISLPRMKTPEFGKRKYQETS